MNLKAKLKKAAEGLYFWYGLGVMRIVEFKIAIA